MFATTMSSSSSSVLQLQRSLISRRWRARALIACLSYAALLFHARSFLPYPLHSSTLCSSLPHPPRKKGTGIIERYRIARANSRYAPLRRASWTYVAARSQYYARTRKGLFVSLALPAIVPTGRLIKRRAAKRGRGCRY